jgi:hypothetical protein
MKCAEEYEKGNTGTKMMIHCGDAYIRSMFQNLGRGEMARIVERCVFAELAARPSCRMVQGNARVSKWAHLSEQSEASKPCYASSCSEGLVKGLKPAWHLRQHNSQCGSEIRYFFSAHHYSS